MPLLDRALVVGINSYPGLTTLTGAENDADAFYEWVTDPNAGGVDPANALKLRSSDFPNPGGPNTAKPIREQIDDFFTSIDDAAEANNRENLGLRAGKRLWMFFAGHGFAPALDRSAVLMANATPTRVHNVAAILWANRLYQGGWFDEVLLFQDACRERVRTGDLIPPFFVSRQAPNNQTRSRFYAFSAKDGKLSKESLIDGKQHGVFTTTLLRGLRGGARDPDNGAVTTARLKDYLEQNMQNLLSKEEKKNPEIATMPEVWNPERFEVVRGAGLPLQIFPARITGIAIGVGALVLDAEFKPVANSNPAADPWNVSLPIGLYSVVTQDGRRQEFKVTGALQADGTASEIHVAIH